jgi:hypothetical protein
LKFAKAFLSFFYPTILADSYIMHVVTSIWEITFMNILIHYSKKTFSLGSFYKINYSCKLLLFQSIFSVTFSVNKCLFVFKFNANEVQWSFNTSSVVPFINLEWIIHNYLLEFVLKLFFMMFFCIHAFRWYAASNGVSSRPKYLSQR